VFSTVCFENRAVCEIMWKNMVEPDRPQMTIWRMRIACWTPKTTDALTTCTTHFSSSLNIPLHPNCLSFYLFLSSICCIFFLFPPFFSPFFSSVFNALLASDEKRILTLSSVLSSKDRNFFISDSQIMRQKEPCLWRKCDCEVEGRHVRVQLGQIIP
jgi:hypothetical protein